MLVTNYEGETIEFTGTKQEAEEMEAYNTIYL